MPDDSFIAAGGAHRHRMLLAGTGLMIYGAPWQERPAAALTIGPARAELLLRF